VAHENVTSQTHFALGWQTHGHVQLGDVDVPVVSLDDLIQMKLARGRPLTLPMSRR